jgi:hypothetical protein
LKGGTAREGDERVFIYLILFFLNTFPRILWSLLEGSGSNREQRGERREERGERREERGERR